MSPDLDFSEFHDLTHRIGSPYCRSLPGGILRHLEMKWDYQWVMPQALWGKPLCWLGRHSWTEVWDRGGEFTRPPDRWMCFWCWKEKPE
jgi:hypothetical protein